MLAATCEAGCQPARPAEPARDPRVALSQLAIASPPPTLDLTASMDALKALPPVTRTLLLATAACTVPPLLALMSVYPLVFIPDKVRARVQAPCT